MENNVIIPKSSSITSDFEKALTHFKSEILPSRIIIYDETHHNLELEAIRETLGRYPWHKHSSFLHTPKIEVLPSTILMTALVETAGGSLVKELSLGEEKEETERQETVEDVFGFVKNKDIAQQEISPYKPDDQIEIKPSESERREEIVSESRLPLKDKLRFPTLKFPQLSSFLYAGKKFTYIFLIGGVFVMIAAFAFAFFWFYPKNTISLVVYPSSTTNDVDVVFTTDTRLESDQKVVLAKSVSEEVSGEKTASVSGKKKVGEAARGEIVIYNKTLNSKTFPKGTVLTLDKLNFTLDGEVQIASASDTGEGLTFGKSVTKITASEIGPDNNIASGTTLTFKDFPQSSYYAKTSQNLTGGTSREVTSVSQEDQDQLLSQLTDELTGKAKQRLLTTLGPGDKLLEKSIEKNIISKKFNKEVDMEGKDLKLNLTLKIAALAFKEEDLTTLAKEENTIIPTGYTQQKDQSQIRIGETTVDKKGNILARATISNYYLPDIDTENIKNSIIGKSYQEAARIASNNKVIAAVEIVRDTTLPLFSQKLPMNKANLTVNVVAR